MRAEVVCADQSEWRTRTVIADNGQFRLVLFPDIGAKIFSLVHNPTGKELLWRNPAVMPAEIPAGSGFDDTWAGGWDELFPNDEPASMNGSVYPDHGELWTARWTCDLEQRDHSATAYLTTECPISHCRVEKWITMEDGQSKVRFRHRLANLCDRPLRYLWKIHPALTIAPGDHILIPAGRIRLEPEFLGTLGRGALDWNGPVLDLPGRTVDLRIAPPRESGEVHFFYGLELRDGWCATYDPVRKLALGWAFPKDLFTNCWLFASYGGWRGHYVAVLEPCTTFPFRLEQAVAFGECPVLAPFATREASVVFSVREHVDGVSHVSPSGDIYA